MHRTEQLPAIPHTDPPQQSNTTLKGPNHTETQPTSPIFCGSSFPQGMWLIVVGRPWLDTRLLLNSAEEGRENTTEGSRVEMRTQRCYSPVTSTGKTGLI